MQSAVLLYVNLSKSMVNYDRLDDNQGQSFCTSEVTILHI
jgi:hypothetical protein